MVHVADTNFVIKNNTDKETKSLEGNIRKISRGRNRVKKRL